MRTLRKAKEKTPNPKNQASGSLSYIGGRALEVSRAQTMHNKGSYWLAGTDQSKGMADFYAIRKDHFTGKREFLIDQTKRNGYMDNVDREGWNRFLREAPAQVHVRQALVYKDNRGNVRREFVKNEADIDRIVKATLDSKRSHVERHQMKHVMNKRRGELLKDKSSQLISMHNPHSKDVMAPVPLEAYDEGGFRESQGKAITQEMFEGNPTFHHITLSKNRKSLRGVVELTHFVGHQTDVKAMKSLLRATRGPLSVRPVITTQFDQFGENKMDNWREQAEHHVRNPTDMWALTAVSGEKPSKSLKDGGKSGEYKAPKMRTALDVVEHRQIPAYEGHNRDTLLRNDDRHMEKVKGVIKEHKDMDTMLSNLVRNTSANWRSKDFDYENEIAHYTAIGVKAHQAGMKLVDNKVVAGPKLRINEDTVIKRSNTRIELRRLGIAVADKMIQERKVYGITTQFVKAHRNRAKFVHSYHRHVSLNGSGHQVHTHPAHSSQRKEK
jgi:hypothetical protein